jgi:WD40 repeat protein
MKDGNVHFFDTTTGNEIMSQKIAEATVSSASFHPTLNLLLTTSGERVLPSLFHDEDDENSYMERDEKDFEKKGHSDASVWTYKPRTHDEIQIS